MDDIINAALNGLIALGSGISNLFTSWLPNDPFASYISGLQFTQSAFTTGFSWLAWFIDLPTLSAIFIVWVTAITTWLIVQLAVMGFKFARDILDSIPFIG